MTIKAIFFGLAACLAITNCFACMEAHQNRLFPIGMCTEGLVVLEAHLHRTSTRESRDEVWYGYVYLNVYDGDNKIQSELIDTLSLFPDSLTEKILSEVFEKGMRMSNKLQLTELAIPQSIYMCDYQKQCNSLSIETDSLQNTVAIDFQGNGKYPVTPLSDSHSIASEFLDYFGPMISENDLYSLGNMLFMNSVRTFSIGSKNLMIIHLESGQTFETVDGGSYPPEKEYQPDFEFTEKTNGVFKKPVLHHGHGFDFMFFQ